MNKLGSNISSEIVGLNIKNLLDRNSLKQKEFAEQIYESSSTISKWCNGKQLPTGEQIIKIIEFFNIEPNELFYNKAKLEKINYKKSNKVIKPVLAQKNVVVKCIKERMNKIHYFIIEASIILYFIWFIMLIVNTGAIESNNYYITLLSLVIMSMGGSYLFNLYSKKQFVKKTFIIGHTEDIYYEIQDTTNKYYSIIGIIKLISIIVYIISIFVVTTSYIGKNTVSNIINIFIIFLICMFLFVEVTNLFLNKKTFDKRKKSQHFVEYKRSVADIFLPLFSLFLVTAFHHLYTNLTLFIILNFILLILGIVTLILMTKQMMNYKLVYENYNEEVVLIES